MEMNMGQNKSRMMLFITIAIVAVAGILIYMFRTQITDMLTGLTGKTPQPDLVQQQVIAAQTRWDKMALKLEALPAPGNTVHKDTIINYTATIQNNNVGKAKAINLVFLAKLPYEVDPEIVSIPTGSTNKSKNGLVAITGIGVGDSQSQTITFSMKVPANEIRSNEDETLQPTGDKRINTTAFLIPAKKPSVSQEDLLEWAQGKTVIWEDQEKAGMIEEIEFILEGEEETTIQQEEISQGNHLKAEASSLLTQQDFGAGSIEEQERFAIDQLIQRQRVTKDVQTAYLDIIGYPAPPSEGYSKGDTINFIVFITSDYTFPDAHKGTLVIELPFKNSSTSNVINADFLPVDSITNEPGKVTLNGLSITEGEVTRLTFSVLVPQELQISNLNKCVDMGQSGTERDTACTKISLIQSQIPTQDRTVKRALVSKLNVGVGPIDPVDPVGPIDPVDPVGPIDPVDPVGPIFPVIPVPVRPKIVSIEHIRGIDQLIDEKVTVGKKVKKIEEKLEENIEARAGEKIIYELKAENTTNATISQYLISDDVSDLEAYATIEKVETLLSDGTIQTTTYNDSRVEALVSLEPNKSATTIIQAQIKPIEQWPQDNDKKIINTFLDKQTTVGLIKGAEDEDKSIKQTGTSGGGTAGTKTASVETGVDTSTVLILIYSGLAVIGATLIYLVIRQKA